CVTSSAMQRIVFDNSVGARSLRNYYILFSIGRTPDIYNLPTDIKNLAIVYTPANYKWHG
ncbi:MAG: hypothetical protein K2I03_01680, partial [Lachnospiraceae bacterium]|nr:hypothetical protein [Lachnospiraceae bacterium]